MHLNFSINVGIEEGKWYVGGNRTRAEGNNGYPQ
jgi:hypothetical protein